MWKLYENFHIFHFQKRIVSTETIHGNTVNSFQLWAFWTEKHAPYSQFLPRPARNESNTPKLKFRSYCPDIYTVI